MSTSLATRPGALAPFEPENLEQADKLAERLARSGLMPEAIRGKPADVLAILLTGRELGLSPMQAIRSIYVVKGRPTLSADLMVALVKRSPECCFFKLVESTATRATYATERKGEGETRLSWTIEQAQRAGLMGNSTWKAHPEAMLRARASSALARAVYPDIVAGLYDPDEISQPEADHPAAREPVEVRAERVEAPPAPAPAPTVEVVPPEPAATTGPDPSAVLFDQLAAQLDKAKTEHDVQVVGVTANREKRAGRLSPDQVEQLRARAAERKTALGIGSPAPQPAPAEGRA